jgi:hypothetical protein
MPNRRGLAATCRSSENSLPKYRETLLEDRRFLFDRYHLVDAAIKVVGSLGTLCVVVLMISVMGSPLFLQVKQANASVLESYGGGSVYPPMAGGLSRASGCCNRRPICFSAGSPGRKAGNTMCASCAT